MKQSKEIEKRSDIRHIPGAKLYADIDNLLVHMTLKKESFHYCSFYSMKTGQAQKLMEAAGFSQEEVDNVMSRMGGKSYPKGIRP